MAFPAILASTYATDEDVAIRAPSDFATLCPDSQVVAAGMDGVFVAANLWVLTSPTVPFTTNGVAVGHVVRLYRPTSIFPGSGQLLAVSAVADNALTLRRLAMADGLGQPPSPIGGLAGVAFEIKTISPQIEVVSYWFNEQYGIDPTYAWTSPSALKDLRQLREATVLRTLRELYIQANRQKGGDFDLKIANFTEELESVLGWMKLTWSRAVTDQPPTTRFDTRIVRG